MRNSTTRNSHGTRLAEWADLVGGSVPDAVDDDEHDATSGPWADAERSQ
ncbi:hypothetical protein [Halogeometricum limi]|nr:hypothetical protein [Halogeometricum limi]